MISRSSSRSPLSAANSARPASLVVEDRRLGRRGRVASAVLGDPQRQVRPATGAAAAVASLVGDASEQPRPEWCARPERPKGGVSLDEPVLGGVLGVGVGAAHTVAVRTASAW